MELRGRETGAAEAPARIHRARRPRRWGESVIQAALLLSSLVSILTTVGIIYVLLSESIGFFRHVSPIAFLTGSQWTPLFEPQRFGVLPLLSGTLLVAGLAALVAMPLGLFTAVFLSEYAPDRLRRILKPILELLAGIPTVVYGYFALTFVTPLLQRSLLPDLVVFNALSAGLVMGVMILPLVSSLAEDAMVAVPRSLREAAYALGATRFEVALRVVVPAALSGIVAAFILALSRAIGETMLVTIAAGATPRLTLDPRESIQTMTAYIAQVSLGETPRGTLVYQTLFAVGLSLFLLTLAVNVLGQWVVSRWRERYA